jgi:hypothetical protein
LEQYFVDEVAVDDDYDDDFGGSDVGATWVRNVDSKWKEQLGDGIEDDACAKRHHCPWMKFHRVLPRLVRVP